MQYSLRTKLNISFLAVIIICSLVAALVGLQLILTGMINRAQDNVKNDLNSAREIYQQEEQRIRDTVRFIASGLFVGTEIKTDVIERLNKKLGQIREAESIDILTLTNETGTVIVRSGTSAVSGDSQAHNYLVSQALSTRKVMAGTVILQEDELKAEGDELFQRAYTKVVATPNAKQRVDTVQSSGMCIIAAAPVYGGQGELVGVLYGGKLINRNVQLVDKIKETAYSDLKYKGEDVGVSTIFQGDIRIATNVIDKRGKLAIGTQMSEEVYDRVVGEGVSWIQRAFVVDKWYLTAYEPIIDPQDNVVGVLAVGVLEDEFVDMRNRAVVIFLGIVFGGIVMAIIVSHVLARGILKPIERLMYASDQWASANLDYRVETGQTDEISQLGDTFNKMASSLKQRDEKLKEYTNEQIIKSERLATLGQLAAGVAHEINNPIGAILMYSHLSLEDMDEKETLKKNLAKTVSEASRCRDIVKGLLDFSRQTEPKVERTNINRILERTLAITKDQVMFRNIRVTTDFTLSLPEILVDVGQMQQVFTNIVLNAADAMEGDGELFVRSFASDDGEYLSIEFSDTGHGIDKKSIGKIFEPFFTTKEVGRGTGLGLAVSYGIITRHRGSIEVKSEPGNGATFIIRLPLKQEESYNSDAS